MCFFFPVNNFKERKFSPSLFLSYHCYSIHFAITAENNLLFKIDTLRVSDSPRLRKSRSPGLKDWNTSKHFPLQVLALQASSNLSFPARGPITTVSAPERPSACSLHTRGRLVPGQTSRARKTKLRPSLLLRTRSTPRPRPPQGCQRGRL